MFDSRISSGKSRQVGVASTKISTAMNGPEAQRDDRYEQLSKTFTAIDANGDKELSFEEIRTFLNHRIGATFDEDLLKELFRNLDKDHNSVVTTEEFIGSYVEAERLVAEHVTTLERQLEENKAQLAKTLAEKRAADLNERMNQNGIMEGSVLTVHIIEAQNLKPMDLSGTSDPFAELACEGQKIETKVVKDSLNPFWDEKFTFAISLGSDDLKITVWDKDKLKKDFEGQLAIPLTLIRDQMKHEEWFELQPQKRGDKWQGRIRLSLQWIWSRRVYFEEMAKQWQNVADEDQEQLQALKSNLSKLQEPFGEMEMNIKPSSLFSKSEMQRAETVLSHRLDNVALATFGKEIDWSYATLVVTMLVLGLSTLTCFARSDFLSVTRIQNIIAIVAFYYLVSKAGSDTSLRLLAVLALGSVCIDVLWLMVAGSVSVTQDWISGSAKDYSTGLTRMAVLLSLADIPVKIAAFAVWLKQGQELKKRLG